jgi:hypothetical protein
MPTIRAHYDGRAIIPDQPVDLAQGQALVVHFEAASAQPPVGQPTEHFLDWVVRNLVAKTDRLPDGGAQHDHYLYGTPKRIAPKP